MFSVMSMRGTCRIWALFTGSAFSSGTLSTTGIRNVELALETADLEIAALFQFSSVYAFSRICGSILTEAAFSHQRLDADSRRMAVEYSNTILRAGFLCVWAFVSIGMLRCLINVAFAEVQLTTGELTMNVTKVKAMDLNAWQDLVAQVHTTFEDSISLVFAAMTVLCVINMFVICSMKMITDRLGNANLMFTGTRLLILALEIQGKLLDAFTVDRTLYNTAQVYKDKLPEWVPLKRWSFSTEQAHLFNLSILNIECLFVVVLNYFTWSSLNLEESGIMRFRKDDDTQIEGEDAPLTSHSLHGLLNAVDGSDDEGGRHGW
eukprot:CAMPEP_0172831030 /NCGR_PEP_ID=MMETSP1075-20121228/22674_1 /TAXON_ID=2916 /ORGANISM="Ceratium fusus, Strain PA161109" /LENGTH=319 /DNA_ID=CAMNT_0013673417 /DNA_START=545 /DNA_END=1501 /DNA_ORIENTATION=-